MNILMAKRLGRWFAAQLKSLPGGYAEATNWPGCPIDQNKLSACGRGARGLKLEEAIFLVDANDMAGLFRSLADLIDGGVDCGDLERTARKDLYDSARLAETVEAALQDGHLSSAELAEIGDAADQNLENATRVAQQVRQLRTGPQE